MTKRRRIELEAVWSFPSVGCGLEVARQTEAQARIRHTIRATPGHRIQLQVTWSVLRSVRVFVYWGYAGWSDET